LDPERLSKLTGASSEGILVGTRRGEEALVGTSTEEDLLGGFYHTRKPYLIGSGSSAWGARYGGGCERGYPCQSEFI